MTMSVTGLAWMYVETPWGYWLAGLFGGYKATLEIHRIAGLVLLAGFAAHILYLILRIDWKNFPKSLLGPKTLVFQLVDIKGFFQHLLWIFGLGKKPRFDRWSWWEKFDYWAVWWGFMIVGVTGLILYNPVLSSDYIPGWLLNVALWVHRIEAAMAMAHIFSIHFYLEHFRPHSFPYNASMFDGVVPLDKAREEHAEWIARLEREGRLEEMMGKEPPVPMRILYFIGGYAVIGLGLFLLVFALMNAAALTLF